MALYTSIKHIFGSAVQRKFIAGIGISIWYYEGFIIY